MKPITKATKKTISAIPSTRLNIPKIVTNCGLGGTVLPATIAIANVAIVNTTIAWKDQNNTLAQVLLLLTNDSILTVFAFLFVILIIFSPLHILYKLLGHWIFSIKFP